MRHLKTVIAVFGIILTILGWYFKQAERYPWVIRFFAPGYVQTLQVYEKMLSARASARSPVEITKDEPGFRDIWSILEDNFPQVKETESVVRMRVKDVGLAIGTYNPETGIYYSGAQPHFEITLKDGKILTRYVNDLRTEIRKRFLEDKLFWWSSWIFWIGVVLSLSSLMIRSP